MLKELRGYKVLEGVRGQGKTVAAVFIPSRARIQRFAPLRCDGQSVEDCLEKLWDILAAPQVRAGHENPHRLRHSRRRQATD